MLRLGTTFIRIANLEQQLDFYQQVIGLQVHRQEGNTVFLGVGGNDLLGLIHTPNGKRLHGQNGLYHFALLLPSRRHLALTLRHFIETQTPLQGLSDHIVSEAIYLGDPEGNGIEIYADRPRERWHQNGEFHMATLPINVPDLLREAEGADISAHQLPSGTIMGHMHLHVNALAEAAAFYQETLGMAMMMHIPTAGFLSYEGYHHHLGINTWAGRTQRADDALGLAYFTVILPEEELVQLPPQFTANARQQDGGWMIADPSLNQVFVTAAS
ncbi:MAG: VOC family protein [Anaerolineaceae bacterium]|nr:VOC family protein [Anaerolineaceae bacterium]